MGTPGVGKRLTVSRIVRRALCSYISAVSRIAGLSSMTILTIIYVVFAVVLLFGAAIFFHELGHFWVARKLGMKVEEFAIGMGPKITLDARWNCLFAPLDSGRWVREAATDDYVRGTRRRGVETSAPGPAFP